MYEANFSADEVVAACVDRLRAYTDAPLSSCETAMREVLAAMKPHFQSARFEALEKAADAFEVNVVTCYDRAVTEQLASSLFDLFKEKQELSYTVEQNDETVCGEMDKFAELAKKTDPRIPLEVISKFDWEWLNMMLVVLQTEQNDMVREHLLNLLSVLIEQCGEPVKKMLIETQLVISLVPLTHKSNGIQIPALHILAILYSTHAQIPLDHLDHLNVEYFRRLYRRLDDYHKTDVLDVCTNLSWLLEQQSVDTRALFDPMVEEPYECSPLGSVLISQLNRHSTLRHVRFLRNLVGLGGEPVLSRMFYENDLKVLAHVIARESINHDNKLVREECLSCLRSILETGAVKSDEDIEYALANYDDKN